MENYIYGTIPTHREMKGGLIKMRAYISVIDDLTGLLNHKGRQKTGFDSQEHFLKLLLELKQNFQKQISKEFLFNLMDSSRDSRQKRQRIRNLLRGVETYNLNKYSRDLEVAKYRTEIKEYGYNKWGEAVVKRLTLQTIGKEFVCGKKKTFHFIRV